MLQPGSRGVSTARGDRKLLAFVLLLAGCLGFGVPAGSAELLLGPGDKIGLTVFKRPDLSGEFRVLPSGDLSLPVLQNLPASGLTLEDVRIAVADRLRTMAFLRDPKVAVDLVEASPITVGGGVLRPGTYPYQIGMTVQHAVSSAGGMRVTDIDTFNARSEVSRVKERLLQALDQFGMTTLRRLRLDAEQRDQTTFSAPADIGSWLSDARLREGLATETNLLAQRKQAFDAQLGSFAQQTAIYKEEIHDLQDQDAAKARESELVKQESGIQQQLLAKGVVVRERAIDLERISMQIQGDRSQIAAEIAKAKQEIARIDQSIRSLNDQRRIDIATMAKDADDLLASLKVTIGQSRAALRDADEALPTPNHPVQTGEARRFTIVRARGGDVLSIAADATTALQPGDMVDVPKL